MNSEKSNYSISKYVNTFTNKNVTTSPTISNSIRKLYSNISRSSTCSTPDIEDGFTNIMRSKSTTPDIESYEKNYSHVIEEIIIDQNIKKIGNEYIFSNGSLVWIDGISTYIVPTNCFVDRFPVYIHYFIHSGLFKKYGYYNENNFYVECELT